MAPTNTTGNPASSVQAAESGAPEPTSGPISSTASRAAARAIKKLQMETLSIPEEGEASEQPSVEESSKPPPPDTTTAKTSRRKRKAAEEPKTSPSSTAGNKGDEENEDNVEKPPAKKTRNSAVRSFDGCLTCRKRHKKWASFFFFTSSLNPLLYILSSNSSVYSPSHPSRLALYCAFSGDVLLTAAVLYRCDERHPICKRA